MRIGTGWRAAGLMAAALALAGCIYIPEPQAPSATAPVATAAAASRAPTEARAIEFGDWGSSDVYAIQQQFSRSVLANVGRGEAMSDALSALRTNGFGCNPVSAGRNTQRPAQLCERQILQNGCTHTWQVMLFDPARAQRAEAAGATYDRVCAGQSGPGGGLLGAPPPG